MTGVLSGRSVRDRRPPAGTVDYRSQLQKADAWLPAALREHRCCAGKQHSRPAAGSCRRHERPIDGIVVDNAIVARSLPARSVLVGYPTGLAEPLRRAASPCPAPSAIADPSSALICSHAGRVDAGLNARATRQAGAQGRAHGVRVAGRRHRTERSTAIVIYVLHRYQSYRNQYAVIIAVRRTSAKYRRSRRSPPLFAPARRPPVGDRALTRRTTPL